MALSAGSKLGSYEILALIGKGGMGEVYRARDSKLGREVAIKILPGAFARDEIRRARFDREAKLLASLNHPNIAAIYGLEDSDDTRFLVLEMVEGETLAEQLRRGPIPVEDSLRLAKQMAEALEAAHEKGVIHRDLKPANIEVTPDGKVKVLDFGLAKAFGGDETDADLSNSPTLTRAATREGVILGTAAYMSPEQARGKPVDKRTDIWAFGCVLYEMLSGRSVFQGEMVSDVLASVLKTEPEWKNLPANIHPKIREILRRCLEKDVKKRYRDIGDVLVEIEETLADPLGDSLPPADRSSAQANWRRAVGVGLVALLIGGVLTGLVVWNLTLAAPPPLVTRFSVMMPGGDAFTSTHRALDVSPDSSRIVFVANDRLYLRHLNQMETYPIPGTEGALNPFFSPDGQWVGFWADGDLNKVPLAGGLPQRLCSTTNPWGVTWGPNNAIFFSNRNIMQVPASGGEPHVVISPDSAAGETALVYPEILPDGDTLLFATGEDNIRIVAQSLTTKERRILFEDGFQPRYLPTGHLVFFRESALMAVPFDPKSLEMEGSAVALVRDIGNIFTLSSAQFSVSRSGALVYIPSASNPFANQALVWVDRDGTATLLTEERRGYVAPRISPDGTQVAYQISDQFGGSAQVWIYNLETQSSSQFTFGSTEVYLTPIWTPDGRRLTFRDTRDGSSGIFWIPVDGSGDAELLLQKAEVILPSSWSPDGALAVYHRRLGENERDIWILDGNRVAEPFIATPANEMSARFSPDGKWIAYESDESGRNDVYVRPYPDTGGGRRRISSNGGAEPVWSPDGKGLFYREEKKMMWIEIETVPTFIHRTPVELFEGEYAAGYSSYDIHPDGDHFLMIAPGEAETVSLAPQINVVLNWSEEVKERVPRDND